ncbi:MAG: COR domain-containing protein [Saprospiraceae bacterium]|nr:COR domain-containing protein [Saprospiraceae bacterium]
MKNLIVPISIIYQGKKAILRYFAEIEKQGAQKLMEAKLLIVGQGGAGKTSLKRKLHDVNSEMPEQEDTTRGIDVTQLDCKTNSDEDFRLNIWDFGGQNVQHYAHQFFLTGSSLYALVTNEREQNPNFQYWLNIIEMLGGKSPVLIVQNEIAGHSEPIKNAAAIRERFDNVVNPFQQVDLSKAATDKRFDQLKEEIIHQALRLPHIGKEYPTSYVRVREALENEAKAGKHYISWSAYKDLCTAVNVDNADVMQDIATTFTILGVCLHFKDDMVLKKFVFLNPKWIIDALFQLIYHEKVIAQKGKFSELDAEEIWAHPDYEGMEDKLIRIMENFELCYRMKDSDNYIVPQRLPAEDESYGWNEPRATKVQYAYKFMPKGLITRLTCRLHEKIEGENVWNDAVIFAMPKARAFVREVYAEERIAIEVSGEKRGDLLNRILDEVDDIHRKSNFANLQVEKLVPCSCAVCSEAKTPHFFDYDYLIELLDDGEYDERCKESKKKVDIREVLLKTGIDFKKHSRRSSFAEASADKWGDWGDLERRGQGEQVILLQKKLNFLEQELIKENDAAKRFTIQEQIEEIKASLRTIREE